MRVSRVRAPSLRWTTLWLTLLLIGGGCVRAAQPRPTGELVWAIGGLESGPAQDIAAIWSRRHPDGPAIRVVALPKAADDQRRLMAIEQNARLGTLDILTLDVVWTGEFAVKGWLADLAAIRPRIEKASSPAPVRSATWRGQLWAAPFTTNVAFLYYRTDLVPRDFAANPSKTWAQLATAALEAIGKAKDPRLGGYVAQGAQYEGMVVNFLEYLWGAGGELFDRQGTGVAFEPGLARQAAQFMKDGQQNGFYADGFEMMTEDVALERFRSGEAVFMRNWTYAYDTLSREQAASKIGTNFGIVALPTFTGKGTTPAVGGQNLAVSRFTANPTAAQKFVEFAATDPEVQLYLAEHSRAPTLASLYADPRLSGNPVMKLVGETLPEARARPSTPQWSSISAEIQQQIYPTYSAHGNPDDAVWAIRSFLERAV